MTRAVDSDNEMEQGDAPVTDQVEQARAAMARTVPPKKRRRWPLWTGLGLIVVLVAFVVMRMMSGSAGGGAGDYTTAKVERQDLRVTVSGSGSTVVGSATRVDPGITGTVTDLSIKLGQSVKAGQLLFRLDNTDLDAAVERAQLSVTQAKQQVAQAKQQVIQAKNSLYSLQHPSQVGTAPVKTASSRELSLANQQVTVANAGLSTANAQLDSAYTSLSQARDNADKRTVTAPVGGLVTVLNAQNGQSLSSGGSNGNSSSAAAASSATGSSSSGAVEISDLGTLHATVSINEVDLVSVKTGQKASVQFDALPSASVSGTVSAISPTGTNSSGVVTYEVDITLASIDPRLRPGMSCSADIETQVKTGALVVPTSAVKTRSGQPYVQVFDIGATAPREVEVTTGATVGTSIEITKGLTEGQYVVTGSTGTAATSGTGSATGGGGGGGMFRVFGGR